MHGLTVRESHVGRRSVALVETAAHMKSAFGVTLNRYEAPLPPPRKGWGDAEPETHVHHGYDGPLHIPAELADIILGVVGLDDRRWGTPAGGSGDPPRAASSSVAATTGTYNFPNTARLTRRSAW
jgi:kumamolisin